MPGPDEDEDEGDDGTVEESLDDESSDRGVPVCIGVLPRNLGVVEVFHRCQPQLAVGMAVFWQGVTAGEVRAACLMRRVPRHDWPRYLDGVQLMAREVAAIRNEESKPKKGAGRG